MSVLLARLRPLLMRCLLFAVCALPAGAPAFAQSAAQSVAQSAPPPAPYRVVGYYTSWSIYAQQYYVDDVPAERLTHLNYAFANIADDGACILGDDYADAAFAYFADETDPRTDALGVPLRGNLAALLRLKQAHPHLQTLLSVGGWTWSTGFTDAALTEESRARFVQSCVNLMLRYGFDGLDIDWEFPVTQGPGYFQGRPEDRQNFTLLLREFRRQLDAQGTLDSRPYLLTIAAPQVEMFWQHIELDAIHPYLDWINLMTYSFHGGWAEVTSHHAALFPTPRNPDAGTAAYNVHGTVSAYAAAGVPPEKLVIGVPLYAHGWSGVPAQNDGLYQPFDGLTDGTWGCCGLYDYADIAANYLPAWTRYWDVDAQAAWLYDPAAGVLISYEDPQAVAAKAAYVQQVGLGGIMLWELSQDDDAHTLLNAAWDGLHGG